MGWSGTGWVGRAAGALCCAEWMGLSQPAMAQLPWHPAALGCFPVLPHTLPTPLPSCLPPTIPSPSAPQVDATVKSWNVKILGLNRQSRHRDATMAQEFWRMLDTHLQARGSTLAY